MLLGFLHVEGNLRRRKAAFSLPPSTAQDKAMFLDPWVDLGSSAPCSLTLFASRPQRPGEHILNHLEKIFWYKIDQKKREICQHWGRILPAGDGSRYDSVKLCSPHNPFLIFICYFISFSHCIAPNIVKYNVIPGSWKKKQVNFNCLSVT